jgi:hypothetical protein
MLNALLMGQKVAINFFNREGLHTGSDRSHKGVIIGSKTGKEKRDGLKIIQGLINSCKSVRETSKFLKIVCNGGVAFF